MVSSSVSEFLSKYFVCNYFLLMTVDVLLVWCGLAVIAKFELIILLSAIIISLNKLRNQTTRMDLFIIFFSISIAIASLSNIYPQAFWFEVRSSATYQRRRRPCSTCRAPDRARRTACWWSSSGRRTGRAGPARCCRRCRTPCC